MTRLARAVDCLADGAVLVHWLGVPALPVLLFAVWLVSALGLALGVWWVN